MPERPVHPAVEKLKALANELEATRGDWDEGDRGAGLRWHQSDTMKKAAMVALQRGNKELVEVLAVEGLAILEGD